MATGGARTTLRQCECLRQFVTRSTIAVFMAFMIASHDPSVAMMGRDGVEPAGMGSGTVVLPHQVSSLCAFLSSFFGVYGASSKELCVLS